MHYRALLPRSLARAAALPESRVLQTLSQRRWCSSGKFEEPSEANTPAKKKTPTRQHELLSPKVEEHKHKKLAMGGAGAALSTAGLGLLAYSHITYAQLISWAPDVAGVSLLAAGGGVAYMALMPPKSTKPNGKGLKLELVPLNDSQRFASAAAAVNDKATGGSAMGEAAEAALAKAEKAAAESAKAARKAAEEAALLSLHKEIESGEVEPQRLRQKLSPRVFVLDFDTRPPAAGPPARPPSNRMLIDDLREQVSLLLHIASPYDEVVLRITSPGGAVTDYGLASAQFARLKAAGVRTTACVDLVAASGGYMIACAADQILAAPFSIVGSIGVVAGIPNVHRLLERGGVEYVQRTAGNYKRTVNIFTPNTEEGLKKFDQELQLVHTAFKEHVSTHRAGKISDVDAVCTGESWLSLHAEPLGLVDAICTSDQYLRARQAEADVFLLRAEKPAKKQNLLSLLTSSAASAAQAAADRVLDAVAPITGWQQRLEQQQSDDAFGGGAGGRAGGAWPLTSPCLPMDGCRSALDGVMPRAEAPLALRAEDKF